jgi:hypothetical protein
MKQLIVLLCCSGALACAADLDTAKTVYVLSMAHGLDQYLASRLAADHVFQVVTDPKLADVIFTDHLGESFEAKLELISPSPEPVKAVPEDTKDDSDQPPAPPNTNPFLSDAATKVAPPVGNSFARTKGIIFLVDAKSRQVIWSTYDPAKGASDKLMDRTASDIVSRLKKDLKKK